VVNDRSDNGAISKNLIGNIFGELLPTKEKFLLKNILLQRRGGRRRS